LRYPEECVGEVLDPLRTARGEAFIEDHRRHTADTAIGPTAFLLADRVCPFA
jgi:hypothetical protein